MTPTTDPIQQGVASTKSAATANGGAVNFQWEPDANVNSDPVIVKETLQGGYERDPQLTCIARNVLQGTQRNITPTAAANGNWNLGAIGPREIVTCYGQEHADQTEVEEDRFRRWLDGRRLDDDRQWARGFPFVQQAR